MAAATPELTLYTAKVCPWAQRVTLALNEVGADVKQIEIDLSNKPSWYASKINPASKVPVLQVGDDEKGVKIPESHVLLELVSDLYPGKLLPSDPIKRAEARYFIERFHQVVSTPYFAVLLHGKTDAVACMLIGIKEIQGLLAKSDGPFALGKEISAADLGVAPFVGRIMATGKAGMLVGNVYETLTSDKTYAPFVAYADALMKRESWSATFDEQHIIEHMRKRVQSMRAQAQPQSSS